MPYTFDNTSPKPALGPECDQFRRGRSKQISQNDASGSAMPYPDPLPRSFPSIRSQFKAKLIKRELIGTDIFYPDFTVLQLF